MTNQELETFHREKFSSEIVNDNLIYNTIMKPDGSSIKNGYTVRSISKMLITVFGEESTSISLSEYYDLIKDNSVLDPIYLSYVQGKL